jgi:hypothetical protein
MQQCKQPLLVERQPTAQWVLTSMLFMVLMGVLLLVKVEP